MRIPKGGPIYDEFIYIELHCKRCSGGFAHHTGEVAKPGCARLVWLSHNVTAEVSVNKWDPPVDL